jgi:hypothetical protein
MFYAVCALFQNIIMVFISNPIPGTDIQKATLFLPLTARTCLEASIAMAKNKARAGVEIVPCFSLQVLRWWCHVQQGPTGAAWGWRRQTGASPVL